jgi:HK97 family phage major capsid protein/HK97 family phage prohead protease
MAQKDIKGAQLRDLRAELTLRAEGEKRGLSFSASSTEPYDRWFGTEVLSHDKGAVRMERITRGAVPLLFNHNWDDPIGMVNTGRLADGRLMVDADVFATARASEVMQMVEGGLRNVSIGYRVHEFLVNEKDETYTATDWEPLEVSIVTVPADSTVGIGRAAVDDTPARLKFSPPAARAASHGDRQMTTAVDTPAAGQQAASHITVTDNGGSPLEQEKKRVEAIRKLCKANDLDERYAELWARNGTSWDQIGDEIIQIKQERNKQAPQSAAHLGMSQSETRKYSLARAIHAVATKDWSKASLESEASKAVAQRLGRMAGEYSFFIPMDVQMLQRDLAVGTASVGGNLVGTTVMSFIEQLRNRSVVMRMGATMMPGLTSFVAIPRQITAGTGFWLANEQGTATESQPTFNQLTLSPRTVAGYTEISRQLLLQTAGQADSIVNTDLARVIGLAVDSAALHGPGTGGQPSGITVTAGLGTSNPTTGTNVAYADMIRFQTTVAGANAMFPGFGYVTTPVVAGILMGKPRFTNSDTPIWGGNLLDGQVVGAPAMSSLQVGSGSMLAGDFSQVMIGEWGALEIEVNPYAQFQSGIIGVRAMYTCDVGVRYGAAFALGTGMTG